MARIGKAKRVLVGEGDSTLRSRSAKLTSSGAAIRGSAIEGNDRAARVRELGRRGLPPYPDMTLIPQIVLPKPALITPDMESPGRVAMLGAAYRSACLNRCGIRSNFMLTQRGARAGQTRSPTYEPTHSQLVTAAELMAHHELPPVSWTLFSFDVWFKVTKRSRPPQVRWTFSKKGFTTRLQWFEDEREYYTVTQSYVAPLHRELVTSWHEMWDALLRFELQTREQVLDVVELYFPGGTWEKRMADAKTEAVRMQRDLDEKTAAGEEGGLWRR